MRFFSFVLLLVAAVGSRSETAVDVFGNIFDSCLKFGSFSCVKPKFLKFLSDSLKNDRIVLTEDLSIEKNEGRVTSDWQVSTFRLEPSYLDDTSLICPLMIPVSFHSHHRSVGSARRWCHVEEGKAQVHDARENRQFLEFSRAQGEIAKGNRHGGSFSFRSKLPVRQRTWATYRSTLRDEKR